VWDLYRPRPSHRARKNNSKGRALDSAMAEGPSTTAVSATVGPTNETLEEILDPNGDLYDPPPLPPSATGPQIRSALHSMAIAALCNCQSMEVDGVLRFQVGPLCEVHVVSSKVQVRLHKRRSQSCFRCRGSLCIVTEFQGFRGSLRYSRKGKFNR
jgi:hypothetical protein